MRSFASSGDLNVCIHGTPPQFFPRELCTEITRNTRKVCWEKILITLKGIPSKDAGWPENIKKKANICSCSFNVAAKSIFMYQRNLLASSLDSLGRCHVFTLYQKRAEEDWVMTSCMLLPYTPPSFTKSSILST